MSRTPSALRARSLTEEVADEPVPEPVGLELAGVGLCLLSVLVATALVTLAPAGSTGTLKNAVGEGGRAVAVALTRAIGLGTWILPTFGVAWGLSCLRGRRPTRWGLRAMLLPVLAALTAVTAGLLLRASPWLGLTSSGPGGYLGLSLGATLFRALGKPAGLLALLSWLFVLQFVAGVSVAHLRRWTSWLWPERTAPTGAAKGRRAASRRAEPAEGGVAVATEEGQEDGLEDGREAHDDETMEGTDDDADPTQALEAEADHVGPEGDAEESRDGAQAPPPARMAAAPRPPRPPPEPRVPAPVRPPMPEDYVFPTLTLLEPGLAHDPETVRDEVEANAKVLAQTLASFDIEAQVVSSLRGPVITFYEIAIPSGTRLNRVTSLADDLAIGLKAPSIRIVAPIPGRNTVGIEVPNLQRDPVVLHDIVRDAQASVDRKAIPVFLGRDTAGRLINEDLATMPHLLIAGATGSGKSVCINSILLSILYTRTPAELRLILIDPKQVELSFFEGIPHLLTPVITDMQRAAKILEWAVDRMEERYSMLLAGGVRNVAGYNALPKDKRDKIREQGHLSQDDFPEHLPYLVIVVDELADLMLTSGKEVELAITRLAQKSRAVGIHIILATQRPSTNVITGLIKANMPTRIAFRVASKIDSRVILDANGADKLLGMGDMLYMNPRSLHLKRAQGTLVTDGEARSVVDFLKEKCGPPAYQDILKQNVGELGDPMEEDDLYDDAVRAVLATRLGSASMLQRRLGIGYTRASRLIDMMSDRQVVGPHVGSKAREVLYTLEQWDKLHGGAGGAAAAEAGPTESFAATEQELEERCVDESWE